MKLAIFSDIHSNLEALEACHERARKLGAEGYVCLGDITGYGADPAATVDKLIDITGYGADPAATVDKLMSLKNLIVVRGNHDEALFAELSEGVKSSLKKTVEWTRNQLSKDQLRFLESLPYLLEVHGVTFVHSSADHPGSWEYLGGGDTVEHCMQAANTNVTFIGHVHIPRVFYETGSGEVRELKPRDGVSIPLMSSRRYVINVGSVGQPRDGPVLLCLMMKSVK
jgi:predicted phosphodiesterase